jgi:hypothetical protein
MQSQSDAEIVYSTAVGYNHNTGERRNAAITVEISDVDINAVRWWAAIMAPDQGWKAVVPSATMGVPVAVVRIC